MCIQDLLDRSNEFGIRPFQCNTHRSYKPVAEVEAAQEAAEVQAVAAEEQEAEEEAVVVQEAEQEEEEVAEAEAEEAELLE
jgi:hypothetical protein